MSQQAPVWVDQQTQCQLISDDRQSTTAAANGRFPSFRLTQSDNRPLQRMSALGHSLFGIGRAIEVGHREVQGVAWLKAKGRHGAQSGVSIATRLGRQAAA